MINEKQDHSDFLSERLDDLLKSEDFKKVEAVAEKYKDHPYLCHLKEEIDRTQKLAIDVALSADSIMDIVQIGLYASSIRRFATLTK
jgi:hypothetical protein